MKNTILTLISLIIIAQCDTQVYWCATTSTPPLVYISESSTCAAAKGLKYVDQPATSTTLGIGFTVASTSGVVTPSSVNLTASYLTTGNISGTIPTSSIVGQFLSNQLPLIPG